MHRFARPQAVASTQSRPGAPPADDGYKWIALSNTVLASLIITIDSTIVLIGLPAIFRGIHINPLLPGNTKYMLWMMLGFTIVVAVLVVSLGRLGDIYGRVRIYNLGFVVFTVFSILLSVVVDDRCRRARAISSRCGSGRASAARCCSPTPGRSSPTPSP